MGVIDCSLSYRSVPNYPQSDHAGRGGGSRERGRKYLTLPIALMEEFVAVQGSLSILVIVVSRTFVSSRYYRPIRLSRYSYRRQSVSATTSNRSEEQVGDCMNNDEDYLDTTRKGGRGGVGGRSVYGSGIRNGGLRNHKKRGGEGWGDCTAILVLV